MINVIMLVDAYGLQAGQYSQFTDSEYARLFSKGVCKEIEIETKAEPIKAAKTATKKK